MELVSGPLDELVADFKAAVPPADARDYHNHSVEVFEQGVKTAKDKKDPAVLNGIDFGKAPAGLGARLQIAANDDPDCKTAGIRFDS
jgi:hypothetical protein